MESEDVLTVQGLSKVAEKALEYQRYIFRRAYGVFYIVWATAMVLLGATNLSASVGLSGELGVGLNLAVGLVILVSAVGATAIIFRGARRALELREALGHKRKNYARYFVAWFVTVYAVLLAADAIFPAYSNEIGYALILQVPVLLYYMLGVAFPDGRPFEGLIALAVYGAATALNLALSILGTGAEVAGWLWVVTAIVWFLAAFYGLLRAPDELEALRT